MPADCAALAFHGGNLAAARLAFPEAPEPWIDLSTGINPHPYPFAMPAAAAWTRLPDSRAVADLEAAAARVFGAPPAAAVVAAPGTQALIQWLPRLIPGRRVGILGFTYGEHARVWRAAGADVRIAAEVQDLAGCDVAVIVNPNNPDGRVVAAPELAALAAGGTNLIVDEAFMDVLPEGSSFAPYLPSGCVILRSFGKAYGLAGLRLGFAIVPPDRAGFLREALGPWAVSGPAVAIGREALADASWLSDIRSCLQAAATRLDQALLDAGFQLLGGTPLFRLARHAAARTRFQHLARAGILVRPFADRPDWLRFGLPGGDDAWRRLKTAILSD